MNLPICLQIGSVRRVNEADVMAACGENGIRRMVAAFYRRVRTDDLIGPMYPEGDWDAAEERLTEFLLFRLGASTRYIETRGHPKLRMRHITFRIGIAERDRWVELMTAAYEELVRVPGVGPGSARRIVAERRTNLFRGLTDLRKIGVLTGRASGFLSLRGRRLGNAKWAQQLGFWAPEDEVGSYHVTYEVSPGTFR